MAESDASRLVELSKSVQAPTPKWHKTVKARTPRFTTPRQPPSGAKFTVAYTSTEKRRVGTASSTHHRHRHDKSIQDSKLEREDGDRFVPNRTLTDFNYVSEQMLHGEPPGEEKSDGEDPPKSMYEFGSSCKRKVKGTLNINFCSALSSFLSVYFKFGCSFSNVCMSCVYVCVHVQCMYEHILQAKPFVICYRVCNFKPLQKLILKLCHVLTGFDLGIQPPSSGRSLSTSRKPKLVKDIRKVPTEPEKILDAPEVMDDFCKFKNCIIPYRYHLMYNVYQGVYCAVQMLIRWHGV